MEDIINQITNEEKYKENELKRKKIARTTNNYKKKKMTKIIWYFKINK